VTRGNNWPVDIRRPLESGMDHADYFFVTGALLEDEVSDDG
jgi:hypothetical protein